MCFFRLSALDIDFLESESFPLNDMSALCTFVLEQGLLGGLGKAFLDRLREGTISSVLSLYSSLTLCHASFLTFLVDTYGMGSMGLASGTIFVERTCHFHH